MLIGEKAILSAVPSPVLLFDGSGAILYANAGAEDFFHTGATALSRQSLADLVPFASPVLAVVDQARESGSHINEYGVIIGTPRNGGARLVDLQARRMDEAPGCVLVLVRERSLALTMDRQLTHRAAARAVTGMAAMLAHEIKNPLAGIRGAAQLLEPALNADDRALARLICDETDRIAGLLNQMEVFSDERPLECGPVNIHAVLGRVRMLFEAAGTGSIIFREEYDPSLPPVLGHRDQLIQVFINLVKNALEAIEATGQTGEICLTTAYRPGVHMAPSQGAVRVSLPMEVCVQDTGGGIAEEIRQHIFDPFVTTRPGGRGLGLALVAKIVGDHGGIVECNPRERGTCFRVLLPMFRADPSKPKEPVP